MRRSDREITDFQEIIAVMNRCDVCRLGLVDSSGRPYIVPLSFGLELKGKQISLYFHSANEGKKLDLIRQGSPVCFEMDCAHQPVFQETMCRCTMKYQSVFGDGVLHFVEEAEKAAALRLLTAHYFPDHRFDFSPDHVPSTTVLRLDVIHLSAKQHQ